MDLKPVTTVCLFTSLSLFTLSAMAQSELPESVYMYSDQLDVAKVLSLTEEPSETCVVVQAKMTYLDSQDQKQVLDYEKLAKVCEESD